MAEPTGPAITTSSPRAPRRPAALVGQSGGPTAVINASLAGVVAEALGSGQFGRVLGMRDGIAGALDGRLVDLSAMDEPSLRLLAETPSAALGSCRYRLRPGDAERVVALCRREGVGAFVYIGGNDSADTSHQVAEAASAALPELRVVGVPKTIDNDLAGTDHCPGYGSAARFVAQTTREAAFDTRAMRATDPIKLVEVMGRHAGWLAGSGWLARQGGGDDAPQLVYLPEKPVPVEQIVADVRSVYGRVGWCIVVLCENQPTPDGRVIGATGEPRWTDAFGHAYYDSPAQWLARELQRQLGVRARVDRPGTIQRMAGAYVSRADRQEAELVGRAAVRYAVDGRSDVMVTLDRLPGPEYRVATGQAPLLLVANQQRLVPAEFINQAGNGMTAAFDAYARPLLGDPLPTYFALPET